MSSEVDEVADFISSASSSRINPSAEIAPVSAPSDSLDVQMLGGLINASSKFVEIEALLQHNNLDKALKTWSEWLLIMPKATELPVRKDYFPTLIKAFLQSQSSAQIKFCLAILRASIKILVDKQTEPSSRLQNVFGEDYRRWGSSGGTDAYCQIFEIIVLGRYINQVQECLIELPRSHGSTTSSNHYLGRVPTVWWSIMFKTVLSSNNEQIKKVIGTWILRHYVVKTRVTRTRLDNLASTVLDKNADIGGVTRPNIAFFNAMLAWAVSGQLCFKTLQREGREVRSEHGELLAAWCKQQCDAYPPFAEHAITWLSEHFNTLNPHATTYIMAGLRESDVSTRMIEPVLKFAAGISTFSPLSLHITRKYCLQMIGDIHAKSPGGHESENQYANMILRGYHRLRQAIEASEHPENGDIGIFLSRPTTASLVRLRSRAAFVKFREYRCLEVKGFVLKLDWDRLERHHSHQALWKLLAESWPDWIADLESAKDVPGHLVEGKHASLTAFAEDCVFNLFSLARRKTYLWVPTTKALRRMYFGSMPDILCQSKVDCAIRHFIDDPPKPTPEHLLDVAVATVASKATSLGSVDRHVHVYDTHADETLGHAYIFDLLNRLDTGERHGDLAVAAEMLEHILKNWQQRAFSKSKRTSQLQACIVLLNACMNPADPYLTETRYLSSFRRLLEDEQSPRNRFLLEWAILWICSVGTHGKWTEVFLDLLERSDPIESNATEIASYIKIVVQMVLHLPDTMETTKQVDFSTRLLTVLVTLINTTKVTVRFTAQASFPPVFEHMRNNHSLDRMPASPFFTSIYRFITKLGKYAEPPEENTWSAFDMKRDMNMATLFEGGYLYAGQGEAPLLRTSDLRQVKQEFLAADLDRRNEARMPIGEVNQKVRDLVMKKMTITTTSTDSTAIIMNSTLPKNLTYDSTAHSAPLQTKSLSLDLKSLGLEDALVRKEAKQGTGPILIGTLVDAAVNIGGLSRAANVFGCHSLHIPKNTMLKDKSFKSTSLDSELHLQIAETKPLDLAARLVALKSEGWTIVGLEQTSNSIVIGEPSIESSFAAGHPFNEKKLPQRAVIVMGAESTGIPAEILVLCDCCVEIKQWGITRSLNVQTAAAVVLFEWRREWGEMG